MKPRIACLFTSTLARSATIIAANRTCLSELADTTHLEV